MQRKKICQIRRGRYVCVLAAFCIFFSLSTHAQRGLEIGGMGGVSYYMGDLNMYRHFYSSHLNIGGFLKYHFNGRCVLRASANVTGLSANDADFKGVYQQQRGYSFETPLTDIAVVFEVNFMPYQIGRTKKASFTPYVNLGVASYLTLKSSRKFGMAIPVSLGMKKNIAPRLVLGLEWSFRRSFSDYLDNVSGENYRDYHDDYGISINADNVAKQTGFRYNNDWYSFAFVTLSYTFKLGGVGCPAYYHF